MQQPVEQWDPQAGLMYPAQSTLDEQATLQNWAISAIYDWTISDHSWCAAQRAHTDLS